MSVDVPRGISVLEGLLNVCVFELLSGALLMRFFHILDVPVNQKDFALACVLFSPTPQAHIHKCFSLPSQKHINIHTHAHTFANTHGHLAFWLACTQPSGQLDRQITHTHTKCRLSQYRLSVCLISSLALLSKCENTVRLCTDDY